MSDLPPGWTWTTIDQVASTSLGKMLDTKKATGMHPTAYLRNVNVRWGGFDLTDVASMDIRPEELERVIAVPGDVIACEGGEPGRAAVWRGPGPIALQKALHRIRPSGGVLPGYLAHLLRRESDSGRLASLVTGSTIKHLPQEKLRLVRVPLPPISEQERIVAAIDEHLTRLDAAATWLQAAIVRLTVLRRRVIEGALEGHAVPLRELLAEPLRNGMSAKAAAGGSVRVLTLTAVTRREFIDANTKLIAAPSRTLDDLWLQPGDIFIQRSNTPELVGSAALYAGEPRWAIFPDLLIRVRLSDGADPGYVDLALQAPRLRRYFQRAAQGIAGSMPKISQPVVEAAEIPLPDLARQREIVAVTRERLAAVDRMSTEALGSIRRVRTLRHSLLDAAFSGRLVHQDPSEEPATSLLDRIHAGRSKRAPGCVAL